MWQRRTSSVRTHGLHSERKAPKAPTTARAVSTVRCIDKPDCETPHFHGAPNRKNGITAQFTIFGWENSVRVFPAALFLYLPVRIKCIKNIVIDNKRLILAISQSSVRKILKNENFCGIICEETNIQARESTPPPIHKPQQATPHGLLRLNRLN